MHPFLHHPTFAHRPPDTRGRVRYIRVWTGTIPALDPSTGARGALLRGHPKQRAIQPA